MDSDLTPGTPEAILSAALSAYADDVDALRRAVIEKPVKLFRKHGGRLMDVFSARDNARETYTKTADHVRLDLTEFELERMGYYLNRGCTFDTDPVLLEQTVALIRRFAAGVKPKS